jgi:hypothetical protein
LNGNKTFEKGGINMNKKLMMSVDEVAESLDISTSHAYKIVRLLNKDLEAKGFITVAGRVSRRYFEEKFYGAEGVSANVGS